MNRVTFTLALIILSNVSGMALACKGRGGGGYGYRAPVRYGYSAPPVYHRPVIQQPIRYRQPVQQQVFGQPPVQQQTFGQPGMQPTQPIARQTPRPTAPTQAAPSQPAPTQAAPQPTQPSTNQNNSSALAFLAGNTSSQPQQQQSTPNQQLVGTWNATTSSGATITLNLNSNGAFSWVALSNGKTSRFDGNFTLDNGTMTLARSSDNQKLAGTLTFAGNGFNFKLNGAKDGGLNFQQS